MTPATALIYKIAPVSQWRAAVSAGAYHGSADDLRDGFIHFSTAAQVPGTAAKFFTGQSDLIVAAIDVAALGPELKWESSRGGALFPHLYGALSMTAVRWTKSLVLNTDESHTFPEDMI